MLFRSEAAERLGVLLRGSPDGDGGVSWADDVAGWHVRAVDEAQEAAVVGRDVLGRAASPLPKSGPTCDWCGGSRQMPRYEDGVRRGTNPCLKCSGGPTEPVDESEVGRG